MSSQPPARQRNLVQRNLVQRNLVLVTVDIVVAAILLIFSAALALGVIANANSYSTAHAQCSSGPYEGMTCNGTALSVAIFVIIAVAILAFFLGLGFFIVAAIRKRYGFFWPLGAIVITFVVFYIGTWVVGMTIP